MSTTSVYERRWWVLAALSLSLLVIGLDNTILNVALPTLARDLPATASQLQWLVDAYVLVFAGLLLTMGSLGDRFGRRRALTAGLLVFGTGSVLSAFAGSANVLIATRALMGVGGALIMPSTLSITTNIFPDAERGRAIGVWAAVAGLGIVFGPVTGGLLLKYFWWGSVFLINVPVIALALISSATLVPESRDPKATPLDPAGALLSVAGLTALLWGIIEAPARGWTDGWIIAAFTVAAVLAAAFTGWERRARFPMLDVRFFRNPRFSAASAAIALVFFALFGSLFFLTQYLQFVRGYSPLEAGVRVIPAAIGLMLASPASARLTERFGAKRVVTAGMIVAAAALALLSTASPSSGYELVAASLFILGLGTGTAMAPATDSIMGSLPPARAGVGSAMNDTTRQVGGALGVAVLGSLLSSAYRSAMAGAVQALPPPAADAAKDSVGGAAAVAQRVGGPAGEALAAAARTSFIDAMDQAVLIAAGIALLGAVVALLFLPARARDREDALPVLPLGGVAALVSARCRCEMMLAAARRRAALAAAPGGRGCPCSAPPSADTTRPPVSVDHEHGSR